MSGLWNAKVFNTSDRWVICLYIGNKPGGSSTSEQWYGKAMGPKRRSTFFLDVRAVIALDSVTKINDSLEWWWLDGGAEVEIKSSADKALELSKFSWSGGVHTVALKDVDALSPVIDRNPDASWGLRLL